MKDFYSNDLVEFHYSQLTSKVAAIESHFTSGISLYGAGFIGAWAVKFLTDNGVVVNNFFDNDVRKIGAEINGVEIKSACNECLQSASAIMVTARHSVNEVSENLNSLYITNLSFDGYFVYKNFTRLKALRDNMLCDNDSKFIFNALLISLLTGDTSPCLAVMQKDMYFCLPEFSGNFDEVFVDAGAFVGDTVERFVWENLGTFRHIYAFEPGAKQFAALEKRMERLVEEWAFSHDSISLVKAGLSDVKGQMVCTFINDSPLRHGLCSSDEITSDQLNTVPVITLDEFLSGAPVTFIKADVEGMEMNLLRGAKKTIEKFKPKMAICIYHYPSDLYEISEYIRSIVPEYKFKIRHHAPLYGDFVLYCSTKEFV